MKQQKEVWIKICDTFGCVEKATENPCPLCGNDFCKNHSVEIGYWPILTSGGYYISSGPTTTTVCISHIDSRAKELLEKRKKGK